MTLYAAHMYFEDTNGYAESRASKTVLAEAPYRLSAERYFNDIKGMLCDITDDPTGQNRRLAKIEVAEYNPKPRVVIDEEGRCIRG